MAGSFWDRKRRSAGSSTSSVSDEQTVPNNHDNEETGDNYDGQVYHDFRKTKHDDNQADDNYAGVHQLNRPAVDYDNVFTTDDNGDLVSYNYDGPIDKHDFARKGYNDKYFNSAEFYNIVPTKPVIGNPEPDCGS